MERRNPSRDVGKSDKDEIKTCSPKDGVPWREVTWQRFVLIEDPKHREMDRYDRYRVGKSVSTKDRDDNPAEVMAEIRKADNRRDYFDDKPKHDPKWFSVTRGF
jgi:hypothetical protein